MSLGATLIVKIGEVQLSDEIGGGIKDFKKNELYNYYKVRNPDVFVGRALFEEGGEGV